jgi:hypothetical protein
MLENMEVKEFMLVSNLKFKELHSQEFHILHIKKLD